MSQTESPEVLQARWVAPMAGPPIANGAVLIAGGSVIEVGSSRDIVRRAPAGTVVTDLGEVVLLPGLVNAHVHLELSDLATTRPSGVAEGQPVELAKWLGAVFRQGPPPTPEGATRAGQAVVRGIRQSLRFGVTSFGDITRFPSVTRRELAKHGVAAASFGEVTAMATRRGLLSERLQSAMAVMEDSADEPGGRSRVVSAVSPHAPYSVEPSGYRACLEAARRASVPIATHLAESPDEAAFLADHAGPLRELWSQIGGWDDAVPRFTHGPVALAESVGLLGYENSMLVHVNYVTDTDLFRLEKGRASVVYCPRTHDFFGHPPHRWRDMLARGIRVCVGTDSTASSPDLNLLDDLRLLASQATDLSPATLWSMATVSPARAMELPRVGSIAPGQDADLVAFPSTSGDPMRELLLEKIDAVGTWVRGRRVWG